MSSHSFAIERQLAVVLGIILCSSVLTAWGPAWTFRLIEAAIFLTVLFTAVEILRGKLRSSFKWIVIPFAAAACWPVLQNLLGASAYPFATWTAALTWSSYAGAIWIGLHAFADETVARRFRSAAVAFGAVIAILAMLQRLTFNGKIFWIIRSHVTPGAMGPFLNYDHYCTFVELLLPIAIWGAARNRTRAWIWLAAAAVLYASAIASASRAGSVLVTLETLVLIGIALTGRTRRAALRFAASAVILLLAASFIAGWGVLLQRFASQDPFAGRREIWPVALHMTSIHRWIGFGLGTWPSVYPAYANWDAVAVVPHATSDWLEWASDGGLLFPGFLAIVFLRTAFLCRRAAWGIGILTAFVHAAGDYPFQKPTILLWVVVLLGSLEAGADELPDMAVTAPG